MKRMPKRDYFKMRMEQAEKDGNVRKATYYRSRLETLPKKGPNTDNAKAVLEATKDRIATLSKEKRIEGAVKILTETDSGMTQNAKMAYLMDVGITSTEYLEALNRATDGALVREALS